MTLGYGKCVKIMTIAKKAPKPNVTPDMNYKLQYRSPMRGGRYALGERPKYVQNMRNPENGVGSATPYLIIHALLLQNMMIFLIRKKC